MHTQVVSNKEELYEYAQKIVSTVRLDDGVVVIALSGDLGAGKTTFVQAVAQVLGVREQVTSPTFVIMKQYETNDQRFSKLIHIDAYRLDRPDELAVLGFGDWLSDPATLVCIEWPERVEAILPSTTKQISLQEKDKGVRHIHSQGVMADNI